MTYIYKLFGSRYYLLGSFVSKPRQFRIEYKDKYVYK